MGEAFLPAITEALKEQKQALISGRQIVVHFEAEQEGYSGKYEIEINPSACSCTVEFKYADPTRFPARIKAAARALCQEGYEGTYRYHTNQAH